MSIKYKLMKRSRKKKYDVFLKFIGACTNLSLKNISVLDVGVNTVEHSPIDNYLEKKYKYLHNITVLSISPMGGFCDKYPGVNFVQYDGTVFPFEDGSFDFVHSNAVIEHVGGKDRQAFFLQELIRVSKKGVFFTTPNKYFPVEMHTNIVFLHFFPKKWFDNFLKLIGKSWATEDYMHLLSKRDLLEIEKSVEVKGYKSKSFLIKKERMLGMTYQLIGMIKR